MRWTAQFMKANLFGRRSVEPTASPSPPKLTTFKSLKKSTAADTGRTNFTAQDVRPPVL
jgi:hypothetical protein